MFNHVDHEKISNNGNGEDCWSLRQYKPILCCPAAAPSVSHGDGAREGVSTPATPAADGEGSAQPQPAHQPRPFVSRHHDRLMVGEWHWYCCFCTPMTSDGVSLSRVAWEKRDLQKTLREGVPLPKLEAWARDRYSLGSAQAPSPSGTSTGTPSSSTSSPSITPAHAFDATDTVGMQQHPNHQVHDFLVYSAASHSLSCFAGYNLYMYAAWLLCFN